MTVSEWKGTAAAPLDLLWWLSRVIVFLPTDIVAGLHQNFILMIRPVYKYELRLNSHGYYNSVPVDLLHNEYYFVSSDRLSERVIIDGDQFNRYLNLSTFDCLI